MKSIPSGTTVVILEKTSDTWYHVNDRGTVGYVAARYLTDVSAVRSFSATGAVTGSNVRLRSDASVSGQILATYQNGARLSVTGIRDGWYKIQSGTLTGYIRSDLMQIISGGVQTLGQQIADFAQKYIGYNYTYGGQSPSTGFDCSGFMYYVYGQFGYGLYRTASDQYKYNGVSVAQSNLKPGDLVFFATSGGTSVSHVGMYVGGGSFVHAANSRDGVILSSFSNTYWQSVFVGARRIVS